MRFVAGFFALVFVFAAAVQWNDPDPLPWIAGYLCAAGLSAAAVVGRMSWGVSALAAMAYTFWFLSLAPSLVGADPAAFQSLQMREASHEEPREALGLALCAGWSAALAWIARNRAQRAPV
jgi:hypothetical protein